MQKDERSKIYGEAVGREEAIAMLGRPSAEWSRHSRRIEREKRIPMGHADIGIDGIRTVGSNIGYLGFLECELLKPCGTDTSLVSDEEAGVIRAQAEAEIRAEIARYTERLAVLERTPEALKCAIESAVNWRNYLLSERPSNPSKETDEKTAQLAIDANRQRESDIVAYGDFIIEMEAKLAAIQQATICNR